MLASCIDHVSLVALSAIGCLVSHVASHVVDCSGVRNNSSDLELLTKEYVRCKQFWQRGNEWCHDYVWVQDTEADNGPLLGSRKIGQVQAIITVIGNSQHDNKGAPVQYTGVFIDLLRLRNNG